MCVREKCIRALSRRAYVVVGFTKLSVFSTFDFSERYLPPLPLDSMGGSSLRGW